MMVMLKSNKNTQVSLAVFAKLFFPTEIEVQAKRHIIDKFLFKYQARMWNAIKLQYFSFLDGVEHSLVNAHFWHLHDISFQYLFMAING